MERIFCIISHTHWDREWYMPYEQFRIRLVDLVDNLLDILKVYPEYIFHLDAQTIVLEDYLEIRPHKKELLQEHIREGRIIVGPWYVQNDFYLTSGEATIRNLLLGSKMAEDFGKCAWVGYAPDQFGLISQLPQILNGFGMVSCIFGRGYSFVEKEDGGFKPKITGSELVWESEDGSGVLAIHLPCWYNNAQRFSEDMTKAMKYLEFIEKSFEGVAATPYLLLMNGVDHLEAQENLIPIIKRMNEMLPDGRKVVQTTMQDYVDRVKEYAGKPGIREAMAVYKGEMRNGVDYNILQGTLSSRIYLKSANAKAQNLLENRLEPVYCLVGMLGAENRYPADHMTYLWKLLIQNHPHDSICGCSRDEVHDHMEDRYERIHEAGAMLLERGMDFITAHVNRDGMTGSDYLITVFNMVEGTGNAVVEIELQFPADEKVGNFSIRDSSGKDVPFEVLSKQRKSRGILSPINLPGTMAVDAYRVQLYTAVEGPGYKTFAVIPQDGRLSEIEAAHTSEAGVCGKESVLENDHIKVMIQGNGRIDLLFKETGTCYENILVLEDRADCGDAYAYIPAENDRVYTSEEVVPEVRRIVKTAMEDAYALTYRLDLPAFFDASEKKRSEKLARNTVTMSLSLKKGSRQLEVGFDIDNVSEDHRLRVLVNTGITSDYTHASTPFDIIRRDRREVLKGINNGTQPNSGLINIDGEKEGIAIFTEGLQEYQHLMDGNGTIAITLLRATGWIFRSVDSGAEADETWKVPGNQCKRRVRLRMALCPHQGNYIEAGAVLAAKEFAVPVTVCFQPVDLKKFTGGRPCVQDSEINEIFFRPDPFPHLVLLWETRLVEMTGKGIVLSALKRAENGDGWIVRAYNSGSSESELELSFVKPLTRVQQVNMREMAIRELAFEGSRVNPVLLKPKEIFTLKIR